MTRVLWGDAGNRFFETGVDRGVLYLSDQDGVAWNGLTSVEESPSGGEARPYYQDGVKFLNVSSKEEFEATIEAFSAPAEFGVCDGTVSIQNGLFVTQQPRRAFSLSYRTMIGNDLDPQMGYKIHLVYNALAAPSSRANATMSNSPEAASLSWALTTLPPAFTGYKPTAHLVIDSRQTPKGLLAAIEDILYGSDVADARIPMPSELISMFTSEGPVMRTNMIANPAFRSTSTTVEARRNLATNPAYLSTFPSAEVRRNLATNPSCETTAGWLSNNTGAWTMSQDSAVKRSGTYSMKSTPAAATVGTSRTLGSIYSLGGLSIPAAANDLITVSCYIAHNAASNAEANIFVQFLDAASAVLSTLNQNVFVNIGAGNSTFTRVKYSATAAPANTAFVRVLVNVQKVTGSNVLAGEFCWFDDGLIEKANVMLPYFDGSTAAALGLTYSWTGTANASASIASGIQPSSASFKGYARPVWVVAGAAADGTNTTRTYLGSSSVANLGVNTLALFGYDAPAAVAGDTIVGRFRVRLINATAPINLTPRLYAYTSGGAGISGVSQGPAVVVPADGTWVDIVTPSGVAPATTGSVRLYVTGILAELQTDAILETSNNMVAKADTPFPWFDGNSAPAEGLTYSFVGAANASASIGTGSKPTNWTSTDPFWKVDGKGAMLFHPINSNTSSYFSALPVDPNSVVTIAATFEVPLWNPGPMTVFTQLRSYQADGTGILTVASDSFVLNPGESIRVAQTRTLESNAGQVRSYVVASGSGFCYVRDVFSGLGTDGSYFDGSSIDADNYFYYWDGAVDASSSHVNTWN